METRFTKRQFEIVAVKDIYSLQKLLTKPPRLWHQGKVLLHFDGLTASEAEIWERKINSYYSACGCTSGTLVLAVAIELYVLFLSLGAESLSGLGWQHIVAVGLVGLFGAIVGKILGLGWARYQLKKTVRQLTIRMTENVASFGSIVS